MPGVTSHLYPPVIATYQPAFIYTKSCRVYFSISQYNVYNDIKQNAQIKVVNQNSNAMVLDSTKYPIGIKVTNVNIDEDRKTDDKYYIEILPSDIQDGFQLNQYYKVQIRFTDKSVPAIGSQLTDQWITENTAYFSEWSTITLVKAISQPVLKLTHFENTNGIITLNTELPAFVGSLVFTDEMDNETMRSYQIKLYNNDNLIIDSGEIYSNTYSDPNELYYVLQYVLVDGETYKLDISVLTRNYYTETFTYNFIVILNSYDKIDANIEAIAEDELGRMVIHITGKTNDPFSDNITVRRSSSRSNFLIWEDVYTAFLDMDKGLDFYWNDYTIESGIMYQYCVQRRGVDGSRGIVSSYSNQTLVYLDDMFLSANNKHVRIRYNPIVSSYKRTVSESKTDTIGSQFPFIKRNGIINYRQFPISGLITIFMDDDNLFTSREELLGNEDSLFLYDIYNDLHRIEMINDNTWEREFREKVMDFLYADDVKLFRTNTEGNILIKLMDISLTPEQALGRRIYTFSATAYEVDDFTLENVTKYEIQTIGEYDTEIKYDEVNHIYGQIDGIIPKNKDVITSILKEKHSNIIDNSNGDFKVTINGLKFLRVEFSEDPYLIDESTSGTMKKLGTKDIPTKNTVLGYFFYVNGVPVYVSPSGRYELKGDDTLITSLSFPNDSNVLLDYIVEVNISKANQYETGIVPVVSYEENKIGQIWGTFSYDDSILQRLWEKYFYNFNDSYQELIAIDYAKIEADVGTVMYIKTSKDDSLKRYVMNNSNILQISGEFVIDGIYFNGIHVEAATADELLRDQVPDNKYVYTDITVDSVDEIKDPIYNGVYKINNFESFAETAKKYQQLAAKDNTEYADVRRFAADRMFTSLIYNTVMTTNYYIFHDGKFQIFDIVNHDILCPVNGMIDYVVELERGIY